MNVFSNRHASSKDIGEKFARHHMLKFLMNGGYWGNGENRYIPICIVCKYYNHSALMYVNIVCKYYNHSALNITFISENVLQRN